MPGQQKSMTGKVVSDKMDKTVVVVVESTTRHRLYHKILRRTKRYLAHDDRLDAKPGDLVRILETRPLSRNKRWRVAEILRRGEVAEIAPREIDSEYLGTKREKKVEEPEAGTAPVPDTTASADAASLAIADAAPTDTSQSDAPAEAEEPASHDDAADEAPAASGDADASAAVAPPTEDNAAPADDDTPPAASRDADAAEAPATEDDAAPADDDTPPAASQDGDDAAPTDTTTDADGADDKKGNNGS